MASNLLWAHLLRKDVTTTGTPSQIPPIVPQDKTATSMRMLIHDTQANLETFSTRLDGLFQRVEDCRAQVVNANKLLDVERDRVLAEILEIAHRCQSEMKAYVGTPAQAPALELLRVSQAATETSIQALEKRIDALQALLQTHSHAMQSIQDQQNALMGAILPLVPVLHGVPPQMDQLKAALTDMVANAVTAMTKSVESVRSMLVAELRGCGHERSSTRVGTSRSMSSSRPGRKRSTALALGPPEPSVPVSSPLDSRGHDGPRLSFKRPRVEGATHHAGHAQLPQKLSRLAVPPGDPPPVLRTPQTPRQPLADLLLPPGNNTPRMQHRMVSHVNSSTHGYMRQLETLSAAGGPSTVSAPPRPPLQPLDVQDPTATRRRSIGLHDMPPIDMGLPSTAGPPDPLSKAIKIEEILEANLTGVISIPSSPLSSPPSSLPVAVRPPNEATSDMAQHLRPEIQVVQVAPPSSNPNPDVSPPKSMSLRDRRAQMSRFGRTETRRFIPLAPWSDEDE